MKLEIEKKWLLKSQPVMPMGEIQKIRQWYLIDSKTGENFRLRQIVFPFRIVYAKKWIKTIKRKISPGIVEEIETELSYYQALSLMMENTVIKYLMKTRHIYPGEFNGKPVKYEIDSFEGLSIIILEVEFESEKDFEHANFYQSMDPLIQEMIITEVTNDSAFSNFNLAEKTNIEERKQNNTIMQLDFLKLFMDGDDTSPF